MSITGLFHTTSHVIDCPVEVVSAEHDVGNRGKALN